MPRHLRSTQLRSRHYEVYSRENRGDCRVCRAVQLWQEVKLLLNNQFARSSICALLATYCIGAFGEQSVVRLTPSELRCEYATNPTGVDVPAPRLFWKLESSTRGQRQTAYRILVGSSEGLLARNKGDLWDSGKVKSEETTHIHYCGRS